MNALPGASRLFGTDGIRAPLGTPPLDRPTVLAVGYHLGQLLREQQGHTAAPVVVLGGDTRESTPQLLDWLDQGLGSAGACSRSVGILPTPGIAFVVRDIGADAGVVVSASHNPHPDNGIKLIDRRGFKWSREQEEDLERRIAAKAPPAVATSSAGRTRHVSEELVERYLEALRHSVSGPDPLTGLVVVLDPGHGAASSYAGPLFSALGAEVTVINAEPDGRNINRGCGSTLPEGMAQEVRQRGAHLGVAFDGDADRAILADETGQVRDGDAILYLWATSLAAEGKLEPPRIVATTMSNLGLERALAARGIELERCDVGDRWVVESLQREGLVLGGEQSGHVVHLGLATTGDGLLTALQVAARVARAPGRSLSSLLSGFSRYPQVLHNVRVARKQDLARLPRVVAAARAVEEQLGKDGRLVLRYSGTEPLARIMIEGRDQDEIELLAGHLATAIRTELGAGDES